MQDTQRIKNSGHASGALLKALSICLIGLVLQACQTGQTRYMSPEDRNAETNAWAGFAQAANQWQQSQRPTYGPATPYRAPTQDPNPFLNQQQPVYIQQPASPWGQGNLWGD